MTCENNFSHPPSNDNQENNDSPPVNELTVELTEQEAKRLPLILRNNKVTLEQAKKLALDERVFLSSTQQVSSGTSLMSQNNQFSISNVQILGESNVSQGNNQGQLGLFSEGESAEDTLLYVINFDDNQGFAILSGDHHGGGVVAMSEVGKLEDFENDHHASILLDLSASYVKDKREKTSQLKDSVYHQLLGKLGIEDDLDNKNNENKHGIKLLNDGRCRDVVHYDYFTPTVIESIGPLMKTRWYQKYVYDDSLRGITHNSYLMGDYTREVTSYKLLNPPGISNYPAGCVPIAMAQIMAYHKHPKSITTSYQRGKVVYDDYRSGYSGNDKPLHRISYTRNFNWDDMADYFHPKTKEAKGDVAVLVSEVGQSVDANYQLGVTGAFSYKIPGALNKFGYITDGHQDYNFAKLKASIRNKRPVYMNGFKQSSRFLWWSWGSGGGHGWVVDGYKKVSRRAKTTIVVQNCPWIPSRVTSDITQTIEYIYINLGWSRGPTEAEITSRSSIRFRADWNYRHHVKMITNIRKKP